MDATQLRIALACALTGMAAFTASPSLITAIA
jgi:hypothetical protein